MVSSRSPRVVRLQSWERGARSGRQDQQAEIVRIIMYSRVGGSGRGED